MAFETAQSIPESKQANNQGFTIWSCGKATLKRRILRSLHWQSSPFKSSSPPTTKTIQTSHQQHLSPLIRLYQWSDPPSHQWLGPRRPQQRNMADLLGSRWLQQRNAANLLDLPPLASEQKSLQLFSCLISPGFPPKSILLVSQEVFHQSYYINLSVFFLSILLGQKVFHQLIIHVSIIILPFRARRIYTQESGFSSSPFYLIGRSFFQLFYKANTTDKTYVQRNSCLRRKAIVILWPRNLII